MYCSDYGRGAKSTFGDQPAVAPFSFILPHRKSVRSWGLILQASDEPRLVELRFMPMPPSWYRRTKQGPAYTLADVFNSTQQSEQPCENSLIRGLRRGLQMQRMPRALHPVPASWKSVCTRSENTFFGPVVSTVRSKVTMGELGVR